MTKNKIKYKSRSYVLERSICNWKSNLRKNSLSKDRVRKRRAVIKSDRWIGIQWASVSTVQRGHLPPLFLKIWLFREQREAQCRPDRQHLILNKGLHLCGKWRGNKRPRAFAFYVNPRLGAWELLGESLCTDGLWILECLWLWVCWALLGEQGGDHFFLRLFSLANAKYNSNPESL